MSNKLKIINLFAGPGSGKSTTRAGLFYFMKHDKINVEEVTEYAKDVVWDNSPDIFTDQLFILANQNRRLWRLRDKVDIAISDCPILLNIHYKPLEYLPDTFKNLVLELWDTYENHNYFINRKKAYSNVGRIHTEDQAKVIDEDIKTMLDKYGIPYTEIDGDRYAPENILNHLKAMKVI